MKWRRTYLLAKVFQMREKLFGPRKSSFDAREPERGSVSNVLSMLERTDSGKSLRVGDVLALLIMFTLVPWNVTVSCGSRKPKLVISKPRRENLATSWSVPASRTHVVRM